MAPIFSKKLGVGIFILLLTLTACTLPDGPSGTATSSELEFATVFEADLTRDWYVATTGDNTNTCATPEEPCLTLGAAAVKALSFDRIHIAAGLYMGADGLGEQLPRIFNKNLTIIGAGSGVTILDANETSGGIKYSGTFPVHLQLQRLTIQNTDSGPAGGCVDIGGGVELTAEGVVLQNCWRSGLTNRGIAHLTGVVISNARDENPDPDLILNGYGIVNSGELIINGGEISNSEDDGIVNNGPLTVTGTTIRANQGDGVVTTYSGASSFAGVTIANNGGSLQRVGMLIEAGEVTISGSTISANSEQAFVLRSPATLRMDTSTISDHPGGALGIFPGGSVELDEVTITNNSLDTELGPTLSNAGDLTINESRIINNFDRAIDNNGQGIVTITDSEISGNRSESATIFNGDTTSQLSIFRSLIARNTLTASYSAVIWNFQGLMVLENSTISNNTAAEAIRMSASTGLSYITVAENSGYGLTASGAGPFTITNLLMARNRGGDCSNIFALPDVSLLPVSTVSEYNIDTDGTCGFHSYSPTDIRLGGLADNGGLTFTHALLHDPDSPAIDAATGVCPPTDQREFGRAGLCDVGAYETNAVPLSLDDTGIVIGTPTPGGPSTVTITTTTPCYNGPGPQYGFVSNLASGITAQLIGAGFTGSGNQDWVVASHPTAANTNCWLDSDDVTPSIPFSEMRLITVPGLPTPTPKPTSDRPAPNDTPIPCYYDANNALICP